MGISLRQFAALTGRNYETVRRWALHGQLQTCRIGKKFELCEGEYERYCSEGLLPIDKEMEALNKQQKEQRREEKRKKAIENSKLGDLSKPVFRVNSGNRRPARKRNFR